SQDRRYGPRSFTRGRESTLEAEGQRRPCRRAGVGPQSLTPRRESTREAEGQRRPGRSGGVGPQGLSRRASVCARGRGTAKSVPGSGGGAAESYPEAESLRSRPRDGEVRARRAGVGPREQ